MKNISLAGIAIFVSTVLTMSAAAQPTSATMKAIVVHQYGGPEVLKLDEAPQPEPKEDEVLIRVMAAGINPVDAYIRSGKYGTGKLPYIPGMDVAGVIEAAGTSAKKFKPGDPVYAFLSFQEQARRDLD